MRSFVDQRLGTIAIVTVMVCATLSALSWVTGNELDEERRLAKKYHAKTEVMLKDGSRVDMMDDKYAYELEWAKKWPESIGQSLYYSHMTGKKPAVILLIKDWDRERRYIDRCTAVCTQHGIALFVEQSSTQRRR